MHIGICTHAHTVSSFFPEALQCYCASLLFEYSAPVVPCASAPYLCTQQSRLGVEAAEHRQEWLGRLGHTPLCFLPQAHQKWKVILDKHTHTDGNTFLARKTHTNTYLNRKVRAHETSQTFIHESQHTCKAWQTLQYKPLNSFQFLLDYRPTDPHSSFCCILWVIITALIQLPLSRDYNQD